MLSEILTKEESTLDDELSKLYGNVDPHAYHCRDALKVYTDGSCDDPRSPHPKAGAGVFFGPNNPLNCSRRVSGEQTNARAELYAVLVALQRAPRDRALEINTDSEYVIKSLTFYAPMQSMCGWKCANGDLLRSIVSWIRSRPAPLSLVWVKAHAGNFHNEEADRLAKLG
ncbi:ribonuclease H-like protein, partial [Dendrothele bispora CBS 962.96]